MLICAATGDRSAPTLFALVERDTLVRQRLHTATTRPLAVSLFKIALDFGVTAHSRVSWARIDRGLKQQPALAQGQRAPLQLLTVRTARATVVYAGTVPFFWIDLATRVDTGLVGTAAAHLQWV